MRRVIALIVLVAVVGATRADAKDGAGADVGPSGDPVVYVGSPGSNQPGGASGGKGTVTCVLHDFGGTNDGGVSLGPGAPVSDRVCRDFG